MNIAKFVKALSEASARTAEKTKTTSPFKFYSLSPKQQEKVVRSANYKLGRDPRTIDFDIKDKELLNSIKIRLNDYNYMNNLRNGKQIEGYSSILDKKADDFLAANSDKISKDLEDYTTVPLDYEEKSNKVDLSKFVDDEDNVLDQTEAIDNLLYNENIGSINRTTDYDEDVMNAKTLRDIANVKNLNDLETKGLTLLQSEPYTAVTLLEDQPELMKALAYRINHNRDLQRANPWKNLTEYKRQPVTIYSKNTKNTSFDPVQKELKQPLDALDKNVKDELDKTIYRINQLTKRQQKNRNDVNKALYDLTDDDQRLYNTAELPGMETEIDPYTGYAKDSIYKYADEPHYSKYKNTIEYLDENDLLQSIKDRNTVISGKRQYKKSSDLYKLKNLR
jgi:hypothetical protein